MRFRTSTPWTLAHLPELANRHLLTRGVKEQGAPPILEGVSDPRKERFPHVVYDRLAAAPRRCSRRRFHPTFLRHRQPLLPGLDHVPGQTYSRSDCPFRAAPDSSRPRATPRPGWLLQLL